MGILNFYSRIASRPALLPLNRALLKFVARGMGYGLFGSPVDTGERWFIRNVLAKHGPQVCFDVGANIGGYSSELLSGTSAHIHAFEPVASTYDILTQITNSRLHAWRLAIGDRDGEANIMVDPTFTQTASLVHELVDQTPLKTRGEKRTELVPLRTVDSFCNSEAIDRLDFIKIDSEGYEIEVLQGAQETLRTMRPSFVQFELAHHHLIRRHLLADLLDLLEGYRPYRLLRNGMHSVDLRQPVDNLFIMANYIAVRSDLASRY